MKKFFFFVTFLLIISPIVQAQTFVKDIILTTDSMSFSLSAHSLEYRRSNYLFLILKEPNEIVNVKIIINKDAGVTDLNIVPSFSIILEDSLLKIGDGSYTGTFRFSNLTDNPYSRLVLSATIQNKKINNVIGLTPYIFPKMPDVKPLIEVYSGQELRIPLPIRNPYFIEYDDSWRQQGIIDYRLLQSEVGPVLSIKANKTGSQHLEVSVKSSKPFLNENGLLTYDLFDLSLNIRSVFSKVNYLNFDQPSYYFEPQGSKSITVQFDYNRNIRLNRTYRIEDQEKPGGRLIGELFTRAIIENQDKVVATLRTYGLHRIETGFLYMKLGDDTKFFTNFNILKKPEINKLSILRHGQEWNSSPTVYPGETIELKFEGVGLDNPKIKFSDGKFVANVDTSRISENVYYATLTIPADVKERSIPITLNGNNSSFELLVKEYERPRPLDFISVSYGAGKKIVDGDAFVKPALFKQEIGDLVIGFDENIIDEQAELYGIQYLEIEIRYWDKKKKLIESRNINDIKIVPGKQSIRYEGYNKANASSSTIKLNDIMVNKTHELRPWSRIEITFKHDKSKYGGVGYSQHIEIYRSDNYTVDVEVSFPAGLLAKKLNESGVGTLTGLSVASMAQFSFYKKNQINKLQPLRVGLGFIALNAFSSITNTGQDQTDIGMVALASFRPLHSDSKVNFPIYAGFGYLFKSEAMFLLIGPGIQFNF